MYKVLTTIEKSNKKQMKEFEKILSDMKKIGIKVNTDSTVSEDRLYAIFDNKTCPGIFWVLSDKGFNCCRA